MTDVAIGSPVLELSDRFWQWFLSRNPIYATVLGDERYDDRLADPSAEGRADEIAALKGFQADAEEINRDGLNQEDTITLDMRRLLRDIGEGRALGDTTTLADAGVVELIRDRSGAATEEE